MRTDYKVFTYGEVLAVILCSNIAYSEYSTVVFDDILSILIDFDIASTQDTDCVNVSV